MSSSDCLFSDNWSHIRAFKRYGFVAMEKVTAAMIERSDTLYDANGPLCDLFNVMMVTNTLSQLAV